ncbi:MULTISPECIES: hypothetical protein [unclassified Streptomyces]|uniref:hypothetical protein n=1 Tax=unclassified Streptomyces TaxID=2593676 RepID=UPI0033B27316
MDDERLVGQCLERDPSPGRERMVRGEYGYQGLRTQIEESVDDLDHRETRPSTLEQ